MDEESEGLGEPPGPLDEPGGGSDRLPPNLANIAYDRERRNAMLRAGGRGCFLGSVQAGLLLLVALRAFQ